MNGARRRQVDFWGALLMSCLLDGWQSTVMVIIACMFLVLDWLDGK